MASLRNGGGYTLGPDEGSIVSAKVRSLMEQRGMKQTAVATATNSAVPQGRLSDLLRGKVSWTKRTVIAVAAALGADEATLLEGIAVPSAPPPSPKLPGVLDLSKPMPPSALGRSPALAAYIEKRREHLSAADIRALSTVETLLEKDQPVDVDAFFDSILAAFRKHLNPFK